MNAENNTRKSAEKGIALENILSITEEFLKGKTCLIVDSKIMANTFGFIIQDVWGANLMSVERIDDALLPLIKEKNIDFAIVHNYVLEDKQTLLSIIKLGIPLVFAVRYLFPQWQAKEYQNMHDELAAAGARLVHSASRFEDGLEKLYEMYKGENS